MKKLYILSMFLLMSYGLMANDFMNAFCESYMNEANKSVEVKSKTDEGATALMIASYKGSVDTVNALIQAKADVNVQSENGWTALMYAVCGGHTDIVNILIEAGSNVNVQNKDGDIALLLVRESETSASLKEESTKRWYEFWK